MKPLAVLMFTLTLALIQAPPSGSEDPPDGCSFAKTAYARRSAKGDLVPKDREDPLSDNTDVHHYRLDFEIFPDISTLTGSTTMTVASRIEGLDGFRFWLDTTMVISSVEVDGRDVSWQRSDPAAVDVELGRSYDVGEVFDIEVAYSGTPTPSWFFSNEEGSPVVSTLSQPWNASDWWAVKDDNADKATGELLVTVPSELTVVSNGLLLEVDDLARNRRRFHWATEYPTSPYLFAFSATVYNTFGETHDSGTTTFPVDFFVYPGSDTEDNRNGWLRTLDMLTTFEGLFGPYPFADEKYAIYQFPFGGGMEHQTATGQGGRYTFGETLTSHELAHQWWGDLVTCATWHDVWLNEGFATYSTALWYEYASGTSDPEARQTYMEHRRPSELEGTVYVHDISDPGRIFSGNYSYSKAAWVVHMLRGVVGDETFFELLEAYRNRFAFSTATTEDFVAVAEDVWNHELGWFFDQWVYGGGAPSYRYGWTEHVVDGQRYLELHIDQVQQEYPFTMPIRIAVAGAGLDRIFSVWNDSRTQHFLFPVSGGVTDVVIDPEDWILVRSKEAEAFVEGPPRIVSVDPEPGSRISAAAGLAIEITFHEDVVIGGDSFSLRREDDGSEVDIEVAYDASDFTATVTARLPGPGRFELVVADSITDAAGGLALDGEVPGSLGEAGFPSGDGVAGGTAEFEFVAVATRRASKRMKPAEGGAKRRDDLKF